MAQARVIFFDIDNESLHWDFGTHALIMYYAKQLNPEKGKTMLNCTLSEFFYRVNYDLPTEDLTYNDDNSHFVKDNIRQVIAFIDTELIPALNSESQDLILNYGGEKAFFDSFYTDMEYLEAIDIYLHNEVYEADPQFLANIMNHLREFLQYALKANRAYSVYVR
jgi:hypothetical protein